MTNGNVPPEAGESKGLTVHIGDTDVPVITHNGSRVLTTELLARVYGTEEVRIHQNFQRNADRFIEGIHFVKVTGADLRALKTEYLKDSLFGRNAKAAILWTDRGAARHAKMLETDAAWQVFGQLEEAYFEGKAVDQSKPFGRADERDLLLTYKAYVSACRAVGLDRESAAITANQSMIKNHGFDAMARLGTARLVSPVQEREGPPSELGIDLGNRLGINVSAGVMNRLLERSGLQTSSRDHKNRLTHTPTPEGEKLGRWEDVGKKHKSGKPIHQWIWRFSVLDVVIEHIGDDLPAVIARRAS